MAKPKRKRRTSKGAAQLREKRTGFLLDILASIISGTVNALILKLTGW